MRKLETHAASTQQIKLQESYKEHYQIDSYRALPHALPGLPRAAPESIRYGLDAGKKLSTPDVLGSIAILTV